MSGVGGRVDTSEDGRMWRLLLARLHPDAGGDHDLFLFASALRETARDDELSAGKLRSDAEVAGSETTEPFLKAWQSAMNCWASRNRETLRSFGLSEHSSITAKD